MKVRVNVVKVLVLAGILLQAAASQAQVVTAITPTAGAGNLGTQVNQFGNVYDITGGTPRGTNLFHSFGLLNVGAGDIANFNNIEGRFITNILGRVTGGQSSNIYGMIQTTDFGAANLYLINPAGWIFGPGASLNVGGAFRVSTADYVRFPDLPDGTQNRFDATNTPLPASGLTADPIAFGFLSANPAAIVVKTRDTDVDVINLSVAPEQTLSLVGGKAPVPVPGEADSGPTIEGPLTFLVAPGGRIEVANVASSGEVSLAGNLDVSPSTTVLGPVNISKGAFLLVGGDTPGTVLIRGDPVNISSGAFVSASADGAGSVVIRGGEIMIDGGFTQISADTGSLDGAPMAVDIQGTKVSITGGALISAAATDAGNAGIISVTGTESVAVSGQDPVNVIASAIRSEAQFIGNGGQVSISAPLVTVSDGAKVESNAFLIGRGGDIVIDATSQLSVTGSGEITSLSNSAFSRGGDVKVTGGAVEISGAGSRIFSRSTQGVSNDPTIGAGNITLDITGNLTLNDGGQIQSGDFGLQGAGITVKAGGPVVISGNGSGISSQAFSNDVGQVLMQTPTLSIDQGFVRASTTGAGNAGTIQVDVTNLTLSNNAQIASSSVGAATTGAGGDIAVNATNSVSLKSGAGLFSTAEGLGRAGSIKITTPTFDSQNGIVTTASAQAPGGDISITTTGSLVHLANSQITTSVNGGLGGGGDIAIDSSLVVLDNSQVFANAFGGPGGNINITADVFLVNSGGIVPSSLAQIVSASSALSTPGIIDIQASVTDVSGSVAQLPEAPLQATELMRAACAARFAGGKASSLVLAGRDGVPLQPGSVLPSPLYVAGLSTGTSLTARDLPLSVTLLEPKDRYSNRFSLLPNARCSL